MTLSDLMNNLIYLYEKYGDVTVCYADEYKCNYVDINIVKALETDDGEVYIALENTLIDNEVH